MVGVSLERKTLKFPQQQSSLQTTFDFDYIGEDAMTSAVCFL